MEALQAARDALPGDPEGAIAVLSAALEDATAADAVQLASLLGQVHASLGRLDRAEQAFDVALHRAGELPMPEVVAAQITQVSAAVLAVDPARRGALIAPLEQAISTLQQARDGQRMLAGLAVLTRLQLSVGNFELALDRAGRLSAAAASLGRPTLDALARFYASLALEAQGRLGTAAAALEHALGLAHSVQPHAPDEATAEQLRPRIVTCQLRVASRRGRANEASGHLQWLQQHDGGDAEVQAARSGQVSALLNATEPLHAPTISWLGERHDATAVIAALERLGRADLARQHVDRSDTVALQDAREAGPDWLAAVLAVDVARGMRDRGEVTLAVQTLEQARPLLAQLGFDLHHVLATVELARCLRIGGRHLQAAAALEEVRALAGELGVVAVHGALVAELAECRRALGDPRGALELARTITEPTTLVVVARAMAALDLGQLDVAHQALSALGTVEGPLSIDVGLLRLRVMAAEGATLAQQASWLHGLHEVAVAQGWVRQQERLGAALASLDGAS